MFKDVQKRLTLLYTAITGLILMILLACIFMWNITIRENAESAAFQNLWLSVSSRLQMDSILSNSYLAQTEAANHAIIHVEENGSPLLYPGSWKPVTDRDRLVELGFLRAAKENILSTRPPVSSSMEQTPIFLIKGDAGDSYYGHMCVIAAGRGSKSLLLLSYITPRSQLILKNLPLFLLLSFAGIICILFISWHFTGRALKPARDGVKKQADFIAAASHELRSPLAVIRSGVSALKGGIPATGRDTGYDSDERAGTGRDAGYDANERAGTGRDAGSPGNATGRDAGYDADRLLAGIDKECSRMARLVSDMLLLASSDAKNWSLQTQSVELDTLLIEAYESFLPLCRDKRLKLSLVLPESPLPPVMADRQRLEQVLSILLDNAISYTPEGREIALKAYVKRGTHRLSANYAKLYIEVQDRGDGIPDECKQHIFDRFYRGDAARNDKKHFGLGLSIAKELVELHGGSITVLDNPGGGSRFVVRL